MKILLLTIILLVTACNNSNSDEAPPPGNPILKDYVKTPLDKANLADKMNDKHNKILHENLEDFSE